MIPIHRFEPTEASYEALVALGRAIRPEGEHSAAESRREDEGRNPDFLFERWVVDEGEGFVAAATIFESAWSHSPGKYLFGINVHPDARRHGIGSRLYEHVLERLAPRAVRRLFSGTWENQTEGIRFLEKRGYTLRMRYPVSELAVAAFDPAPFEPYARRVSESGIQIRPLASLIEGEPNWRRRYYELVWGGMRDVPAADPITPEPFEQFEKNWLDTPHFDPEAHVVAVDGDEWVGVSQLFLSEARDDLLHTGLTATLRDYRRRGIAMALKLRAIDYARRRGAATIKTDNEENNPMYQINLKLGFEPKPAIVEYGRTLEAPDEDAVEPD